MRCEFRVSRNHSPGLSRPIYGVGAVVVLEGDGDAPGRTINNRVTGEPAATANRRVDPVVAFHPGDGAGAVAVEGIAKNLLDLPLGLRDVENPCRRTGLGQRYGQRSACDGDCRGG